MAELQGLKQSIPLNTWLVGTNLAENASNLQRRLRFGGTDWAELGHGLAGVQGAVGSSILEPVCLLQSSVARSFYRSLRTIAAGLFCMALEAGIAGLAKTYPCSWLRQPARATNAFWFEIRQQSNEAATSSITVCAHHPSACFSCVSCQLLLQ